MLQTLLASRFETKIQTADSLHGGLRNLGLQLTPAKAPIEVIVVDRV